jgi:hypothetical protein
MSFIPFISSIFSTTTYLDVKFSEAIRTKDSCCRIFSCSMIAYKSGSVFTNGSFNAVAHDLVSEVIFLQESRNGEGG